MATRPMKTCSERPIRVFGVLNHLSHQYELLKMADKYPVQFTYLENNVRRWGRMAHRPQHPKLKWATYYEPGQYDIAILHVDQQAVDPNIGKGHIYRQLNEVIQDIPKIVINHGTPMWDEMYTEKLVINGGKMLNSKGNEIHLDGMKQLIGDNFMVVNSYASVDRWGWGYPIIHGMEASEWWDLPKEPRVVLSLSPAGLDKYYNRQLITAIKSYLPENTGLELLHLNVNYGVLDFDDYREIIGSSLISIFPFRDSPMPRSRTEAMLSGSCVLTSRHHNADEFIEHGVNGLIMPDNPLSYVETINQLVNFNYAEAVKMGQNGKKTAQKYFSIERWHKDWYDLLSRGVVGDWPEWDKSSKIWPVLETAQ